MTLDAQSFFQDLSKKIGADFGLERRIMSFDQYLAEMLPNPKMHLRSAAQYLVDMFLYFGFEEVESPKGKLRRFLLFDAPFTNGRDRVVGQEEVQEAIFQLLKNFSRGRRVNRLVLLHGPNGSAKTSIIRCIVQGLEAYSRTEEGAIYRFNWIFPSARISRSNIGFEQQQGEPGPLSSYAFLDELSVDAKLIEELRDNPILLIPKAQRSELLHELFGPELQDKDFAIANAISEGELSHKSKLIFDALITSYHGDFAAVMKHIQVERTFISSRYRKGAVTIEPKLRVDAGTRQVTADRSLSALPVALQNQTLFEPFGDLVDGNRGVIEFDDFLKRPLDLNKYLIATVENGTVSLENAILHLDAFFVASANEDFLESFKTTPEYPSFKGRLELIRVPYILDFKKEQGIYDAMLSELQSSKHIAPHITPLLAMWAVLTRLLPPSTDTGNEELDKVLEQLSPIQKLMLYATGTPPQALEAKSQRLLVNAVPEIFEDGAARLQYEGRYGISPRETKSLLMRALQREDFQCLSVLALVDELEEIVRDPSVHPFLRIQSEGPYNEPLDFIGEILELYLDRVDEELQRSMGLVDQASHVELFSRYVTTVSYALKNEKMYNKVTGDYEEPNLHFLEEVENTLGVEEALPFRKDLISKVAAFRLDNPEAELNYGAIFPSEVATIEASFFLERRALVQKVKENLSRALNDGFEVLDGEDREEVESTLKTLKEEFGYCNHCAQEAIALLIRERYSGAPTSEPTPREEKPKAAQQDSKDK